MNTKNVIIASILFQCAWFASTLFGSLAALAASVGVWYVYSRMTTILPRHYRFVITVVAIGVLLDTILQMFRVIVFPGTFIFPPVWLMCLWFLFAMLVVVVLPKIVIQKKLFAFLSMIGGGLSYIAGIAITDAYLGIPAVYAYVLFFAMWLVLGVAIHYIYRLNITLATEHLK